eukprot:Opistho-1_new@105900
MLRKVLVDKVEGIAAHVAQRLRHDVDGVEETLEERLAEVHEALGVLHELYGVADLRRVDLARERVRVLDNLPHEIADGLVDVGRAESEEVDADQPPAHALSAEQRRGRRRRHDVALHHRAHESLALVRCRKHEQERVGELVGLVVLHGVAERADGRERVVEDHTRECRLHARVREGARQQRAQFREAVRRPRRAVFDERLSDFPPRYQRAHLWQAVNQQPLEHRERVRAEQDGLREILRARVAVRRGERVQRRRLQPQHGNFLEELLHARPVRRHKLAHGAVVKVRVALSEVRADRQGVHERRDESQRVRGLLWRKIRGDAVGHRVRNGRADVAHEEQAAGGAVLGLREVLVDRRVGGVDGRANDGRALLRRRHHSIHERLAHLQQSAEVVLCALPAAKAGLVRLQSVRVRAHAVHGGCQEGLEVLAAIRFGNGRKHRRRHRVRAEERGRVDRGENLALEGRLHKVLANSVRLKDAHKRLHGLAHADARDVAALGHVAERADGKQAVLQQQLLEAAQDVQLCRGHRVRAAHRSESDERRVQLLRAARAGTLRRLCGRRRGRGRLPLLLLGEVHGRRVRQLSRRVLALLPPTPPQQHADDDEQNDDDEPKDARQNDANLLAAVQPRLRRRRLEERCRASGRRGRGCCGSRRVRRGFPQHFNGHDALAEQRREGAVRSLACHKREYGGGARGRDVREDAPVEDDAPAADAEEAQLLG